MHYLTIASCVKGEDDYIDDYIAIHKKLGVEAFILYDRDGDNLTNRYKGRDDIVVIKYPEPNTHHGSHMVTVKNFQGFSRWIAFIDCDQVLFSPTNEDLKVTLQEYEQYAQLQVVWHSFANNGHKTKTPGSVYERFTKRANGDAGINNHSQGICDISRIQCITPPDPHRLVPKMNELSVDENHRILSRGYTIDNGTPHISPHSQNKLFAAHYITKSDEEANLKWLKGRSDIPGQKMRENHYLEPNAYCNEVEDTRIKDFWEKHCK